MLHLPPRRMLLSGWVSDEATVFLRRAPWLDSLHRYAYINLINGLVIYRLWPKFNVLRIYATQDITTAVLNVVSTNYTANLSGVPPSFTIDRGFLGIDSSSAAYIDSTFNPVANGGSQNSAHISTFCNTNAASGVSGGVAIGVSDSATQQAEIYPKYNDGRAYFRINSDPAAGNDSFANANSIGHYIANRSAFNATQGYKDGKLEVSNSNVSTAMSNRSFFDLGQNSFSSNAGGGYQISASSIGSAFDPNSNDAYNFSYLIRAFMTTVRVL